MTRTVGSYSGLLRLGLGYVSWCLKIRLLPIRPCNVDCETKKWSGVGGDLFAVYRLCSVQE